MDYPIRKSPFIMPHSPCKLMNKILETYDILKNIPYIFFSRHEQTCFNAIEITKENPAKEKKNGKEKTTSVGYLVTDVANINLVFSKLIFFYFFFNFLYMGFTVRCYSVLFGVVFFRTCVS